MKIYRSLVNPSRPLDIESEVSFADDCFFSSYPLLGIENAKAVGEMRLEDNHYIIDLDIDADVYMADGLTNKRFMQHLCINECAELLSSYDQDGDGYVLLGNAFELSELLLLIIRSYVPIKPLEGQDNFDI